ncbi:MAG: hypothetical protein RBS45_09050 [Anaerolineales bacterium]|jgi:hypothetical protein|nr:hypothetical protein [Anaerolineales bacterium]
MKKALVVAFLFYTFLFTSARVIWIGAQYCGDGTYQYVTQEQCDDADPNTGCKISSNTKPVSCWLDSNRQCIALYKWSSCTSQWKRDHYECVFDESYAWLKCGVYGGGGGGGGNYEYTRCPEGQALSCGTVAEAGSQNKKFCGYKITCNKYYWPSAFNQPEPCNVNNVASTTCTYNCSCCPIGQYRSCTLGASYTNTVSLYVGGGGDPVDGVYNQMMKDTCYRDGVKRRNDIVVSITLKRSYTKKDNTEWQDWEQSCRVQNCSCKAPPTPTLTPQNKQRPADGFAKRISGWESPHPIIRLSA